MVRSCVHFINFQDRNGGWRSTIKQTCCTIFKHFQALCKAKRISYFCDLKRLFYRILRIPILLCSIPCNGPKAYAMIRESRDQCTKT